MLTEFITKNAEGKKQDEKLYRRSDQYYVNNVSGESIPKC